MTDYYSLNDAGKKLLSQLLKGAGYKPRLAGGRLIWNRSRLAETTKLDRASVDKVVRAVDPSATSHALCSPVHEETLKTLFNALWEVLKPNEKKRLQADLGLQSEELILDNKAKAPLYWHKQDNLSKGTRAGHPAKMVKLLRELDYEKQVLEFNDFLKLSSVAAFLIPAPCDRSQPWAIHRLAYQFNYSDLAYRTRVINVDKHPMRLGNVSLLWGEIGKPLKQGNNQEAILRELSGIKADRPVVIALYNFKGSGLTPTDVLHEFWEPLVQNFPQRTACPKVILLMADCEISAFDSEHVKRLHTLSINAADVVDWLEKKDVRVWFSGEFGSTWFRNKINKFQQMANDASPHSVNPSSNQETWNWNEPGRVLDKLCYEFELPNGTESLRKEWEKG